MGDCCCFVCIGEMHVGIVENFGKFSKVLDAGCHFLMCPIESVRSVVSLKIQQLDIKCDTKTKDNVFVGVHVAVLFKVIKDKATDAEYKLTDHRAQMRSYVFDGIRASFPKLDLDDTFSSKDEIAQNVLQDLKQLMADYGYEIVNALITDINPDPQVQRAMNEINASQRLREAANYKAEGEKILLVKAAEADSESKYLVGVGVAKQRKAIMDGLRGSVNEFAHQVQGAGAKDVMDLLLLTQYFDTLKDIGVRNAGQNSSGKTLFLPHGPGAVAEMRRDLGQGFMAGMAQPIKKK